MGRWDVPGAAHLVLVGGVVHLDESEAVFPGRPITAGQLARRLRSIGLKLTRPARNVALIQLAAAMPAAVLADLVGIHPVTATSWTSLVKQDWAAYTAQRATASPSA